MLPLTDSPLCWAPLLALQRWAALLGIDALLLWRKCGISLGLPCPVSRLSRDSCAPLDWYRSLCTPKRSTPSDTEY